MRKFLLQDSLRDECGRPFLLLLHRIHRLGGVFGKGTQSPAIAPLLRKPGGKAFVFDLDPYLERGNAQEVGVGTGTPSWREIQVGVSQCHWFQCVLERPSTELGGFSRNTICSQNKKYSSEGGQINMLKSFNGSLTRMR